MTAAADTLSYRQRYRGLIGVKSKMPIRDMSVLSRIYTPGVGAVCKEIEKNPLASYSHTCRGNTIALISDGSWVYEFGNAGALAVLPKLEAKSVLYKTFANVDAVPIGIKTQDAEEIVEIVRNLAPSFGGICLEGIAAPKCFTVESHIRKAVREAVLHHEFHAAGIIVLAALTNALKVVGKSMDELRMVINGAGVSGIASVKILLKAGAQNIVVCDTTGVIYRGRVKGMNLIKQELAAITNPDRLRGALADALKGAEVFIGLSGPNLLSLEIVQSMAPDPIVFALANPVPEIHPDAARQGGAGRPGPRHQRGDERGRGPRHRRPGGGCLESRLHPAGGHGLPGAPRGGRGRGPGLHGHRCGQDSAGTGTGGPANPGIHLRREIVITLSGQRGGEGRGPYP